MLKYKRYREEKPMFSFIADNIGTIVIGLLVAGIVAAIIVKLVRDKRKGKCAGCSCGCAGCPDAECGKTE